MRKSIVGVVKTFFVLCLMLNLPFPDSMHAEEVGLHLHQTEATITISDANGCILVYNKQPPPVPEDVESVYARSGFLHPVHTTAGHTITALYPSDHKHQNGIFSAWVKTTWSGRKVDFWNVAKGSGRVVHENVVETHSRVNTAGFEVDLLHQAIGDVVSDVLRERWKVTVFQTDGTFRCFDLQTKQTALTNEPLVINEYRYGGVALRGLSRWVLSNDRDAQESGDGGGSTGFLNNLGSDRLEGNHQKARWVSLYGAIDGTTVSVTVLCHPRSFRSPQTARLHPTKPYFCFAPCVDGKFKIDKNHPYQASYRYLITDEPPKPDWLNKQWHDWVGSEAQQSGMP